jgi:hypothetical protein
MKLDFCTTTGRLYVLNFSGPGDLKKDFIDFCYENRFRIYYGPNSLRGPWLKKLDSAICQEASMLI